MHRELLKKVAEKADAKDIEKLSMIAEKGLDHLKECDEELYNKLECELYEIAYGKTISEEMAKKWVTSMKPYGEHWNKETIDELIREKNIDVKPIDFYIVMNMMYNDYYKTLGDEDVIVYAKLTKNWLNDDDAKEDKLYDYWKYIIKK